MFEAAIVIGIVTALITFIRVIIGPSHADRIVAASVIATMVFALIVLLSVYLDEPAMLDVALVYAVLQFVDLIIYAKYLGGRSAQ